MATVIDLLRLLGQNAAPDGGNALRGPVELPAKVLPAVPAALPRSLTSAWYRLTGRGLAAHHALALAASRAGEPLCLAGPAQVAADDLLLLVAVQLLTSPTAVALWLVPDRATAQRSSERIARLLSPVDLPWRAVADISGRQPSPRVVVATYDELHGRLLRFADRGWSWFWSRLHTIALPELHRASGSWANHLAWLIRRSARLATADLQLLGSSASVADVAERMSLLLGRRCRVIKAEVARADPTLIAVWRCAERHAGLQTLANELQARGLAVTIIGRDVLETEHLRHAFTDSVAVGLEPGEARVALVAGIPQEAADRERLFYYGYRLLVMMAADEPHEYLFAADAARLRDPVPIQPLTLLNPYVAAGHLQCGAAERPIEQGEIEQWGVEDLTARLVARSLLRAVGGSFHPGDRTVEPAAELLAATWNDRPADVRDPRGAVIERISPAVADWLGLPGTTWSADLAVASRSEEPPGVDLALDERRRLALPDMTLALNVREMLESRQATLGEQAIAVVRAKVEVEQRVEGLLVYGKADTPAALRLGQPLETSWTALACGLPLPAAPSDIRTAGWSLASALPLVVVSRPGELVPSYDPGTRTLWLVETEPGGAGIAEAVGRTIERLLDTARALARALEQSERYGPIARAERTWLEALYQARAAAVEQPQPVPADQPEIPAPVPAVPELPRRTRIYRAVQPPPRVDVVEAAPPDLDDEPAAETSTAQAEDLPAHDQLSVDFMFDEPDHLAVEQAAPAEQLAEAAVLAEPAIPAPLDDLEDVTWDDEAASADDIVDEITWQLERLPTEIEDLSWAPDVAEPAPLPGAPEVDEESAPEVNDLPPLGHESAVPLNAPRRPARYAAPDAPSGARRGLLRRREGAQTYEARTPAVPPPSSTPPAPRLEPSRGELVGRDQAYHPADDRPPLPEPPPSRSPERPIAASRDATVEEGGSGAVERPVDVGGMIARMRRLRAERERAQGAAPPPRAEPPADDDDVPLRFQPGQRVTCVPYGEGVVRAARLIGGREQLTIEFQGEGWIEVDPSLSAVRLLDDSGGEAGEDELD